MLKGIGFKLQVQLIANKGSHFLPSSTNQEIRLNWSRITKIKFCKMFKQGPSPRKRLGFHYNLSTSKGKPSYVFLTFERLVCYSLWNLRGFVPSNYTRIYRSKIYNQVVIEPSCCYKIITTGDLKPLSGISKSQVRLLVLL